MRVIAHHDSITVEIADWGTLSAKVEQQVMLGQLGMQTPNASLTVDYRVPLAEVPTHLDQNNYQIAFTLGASYYNPAQTGILPFGDSLLRMERPVPCRIVTVSPSHNEEMPVLLVPNEYQRLAQIVVFVPNRLDPKNAEARGYAAVGPTLSQLSTLYRVPLQYVLVERFLFEAPAILHYGRTVIVPHEIQELNLDALVSRNVLVGLHPYERAVNHYREGLVCVSPLHRFLSWFKAIEAIQVLRQQLMKRNSSFEFRRTVVSDTPELRFKFSDLIGQPHTKIIDKHLRQPYRNSVAHWGDGDRTDLSHDHRYGVLTYTLLCQLADDVFQGMLNATVEAVQATH